MSMNILTILQFLQVLGAYLLMTLLLPALLLHRSIGKLKFSARFLVYQMVGNFSMMSLVFILELLHISNRVTLLLFTAVPYAVAYVILKRKHPVQMAKKAFMYLVRLAGGQLGVRLFLRRMREQLWHGLSGLVKRGVRAFGRHLPDIILLLVLTAGLCYAYGANLLIHYGYTESDLPVHNYWINYLGKNKIFVAGIYPFGFHCVIYYLHEVFGIATYVLLRVFCFVQTMMIHYILLAFLKNCCKSKYAPYVGVFLYTMLGVFGINTRIRYYATLPQEYGMLFILPSIYFLFAFFEKKKKQEKEDFWYLAGFAISFSMTLSAHFYDTMIAGFLCIGVAVGYGFRLFRKKYFGRVMLAGITAIVIAVFPMGIAFAAGTPLQGSLGWGLNVITGKNNTSSTEKAADTETEETETEPQETEETEKKSETEGSETSEKKSETEKPETSEKKSEKEETETTKTETEEKEASAGELLTLSAGGAGALARVAGGTALVSKAGRALMRMPWAIWDAMRVYVIGDEYPLFQYSVPVSMVVLAVLALFHFLLHQTDYAARCLSVSVGLLLLGVLLGSSRMGLPTLMDAIRTCIFFSYVLAAVWSLCADSILQLLLGWCKKKWLLQGVSFIMVAAVSIASWQAGLFRGLPDRKARQTNDAILCLTNIIAENEDFTWTICSANDELRMGEDYGYHYETHTFLKEMENKGAEAEIIIPTPKVYFFIEKVPVTFERAYEGGEPFVSEDVAAMRLPSGTGISIYSGNNRWIEMSRIYYWAQKFREIYPNEMTVYYESDNFVCYCVEQDMYSLFNFAVDYGYNVRD